MRNFYKNDHRLSSHSTLDIDEASCLLNCNIASGKIRNSVLINVNAQYVEINDGFIVNTTAKSIQAEHALLYHALEENHLQLKDNQVRADVFIPDTKQHLKLHTSLQKDSKEEWNHHLSANPLSWKDLHLLCEDMDINQAKNFEEELRQNILKEIATD